MMKFILVVLALIAVAAAQVVYTGGIAPNAANLHGPYAASTSSGIRRYGSTGGFIAPVATYAAAPAFAPAAYAAPYAAPFAATYAI